MKRRRNVSFRSMRIADQIQRDLSYMILHEIKDPRIVSVTIQSVSVSSDYTHADVYFGTLSNDFSEVESVLNSAAGYLRNLLFKRLRLHSVPILHFFYDRKTEETIKIIKLIDYAREIYSEDL